MLSHFETDVWLLFGSFAYGLEGRILSFGADELTLLIRTPSPEEENEDLVGFLETLFEDPAGLLRTEIRIYPEAESAASMLVHTELPEVEFPVTVMTEVAPVEARIRLGDPVLRLVRLQALSEADARAWGSLVQGLWPRML